MTVVEHTPWVIVAISAVGVTGALALGAIALEIYKRTFGRRFDRYRRIARLGTGAQLSFFVAALGEPPAMRRTIVNHKYVQWLPDGHPDLDPALSEEGIHGRRVEKAFTESTFIDRDYYIQTICDEDETVLAFSVTTRSKGFKPRFRPVRPLGLRQRWRWQRQVGQRYQPPVKIVLGRTTFAKLDPPNQDDYAPPHFVISVGVHNHVYSEFHYFGNPGNYQNFVWTASDAARQGRCGDATAVQREVRGGEWPDPKQSIDKQPSWADMPETQSFRQETVITTYTVIGRSLSMTNYPSSRFGPHENDVRTIP